MNAFVAPTDKEWFEFLLAKARREVVDEVNFWMPKPWGGRFQVLSRGQPLLFKLKSPWNAVAGGGFFSHYTEIPIGLAWEAFGEKNGARTLEDVRRRIAKLRREAPDFRREYTIGCILLAEPFFWDPADWIQEPPGWHPQIVRGRSYDLREEPGRSLWHEVAERIPLGQPSTGRTLEIVAGEFGGYGDPTLVPRRIGQGTFQTLVTDIYGRRCAVSGERALPALDAAHIRPFADERIHSVRNGILLRSDVHRLFDVGYLTITPELRVEASSRMREDFDDGQSYLQLHGSPVRVPEEDGFRPDPEHLRWHNENRFRG